MAGALLAAAFAATAAGWAATAHADDSPPVPTAGICKTELWGFLGSQRRTLCDGPIAKDGSWSRQRTIWVPAHFSTPICTSYGGSSSSWASHTSCTGGYFVNQHLVSDETYPVRPDTVLPDEPGHLG
ncbi:hypothetical protein AWC00_22200 [Mycobacterium conspicuum]|nr:hypothetical protein AWC00_22200 [Mycobacterium conspicuum]